MDSKLELRWAAEAEKNLEDIIEYLENRWTEREIRSFQVKLRVLLNQISKTPKLFPSSPTRPHLRRAVLSKQTTVVYTFDDKTVYILRLFANRMNPSKLRKQ